MSSLPSFDTENEPKIARSVEKFFKDYKVMELLRRCGLRKSRRADGKVHQRFHFTPPEVHARGYIAITSSLIEYLLAKLLSFQGFIVLFGVGSLSSYYLLFKQ